MSEVDYLRSLPSIRARSEHLYELALQNKLPHFSIDLTKLPSCVEFVAQVMEENYPNGVETVLFHSRWRHFEPGNALRVPHMCEQWKDIDPKEKARRLVDLVIVSVLLDAGAGPTWSFTEPETKQIFTRSEGLGIASFYMFLNGSFSATSQPHRVDADALMNLPDDAVAKAFQVDDTNPLVGCAGRTALLQRLGQSLKDNPTFFSKDNEYRPGFLVDYLWSRAKENKVSVHELWHVIISGLQNMWPEGRTKLGGCNMGDVWRHASLPQDTETSGYVSFHKLSQWLTYSMIEPLTDSGLEITDLDAMTGLPEYRNGGLFVDFGILVPKHDDILTTAFDPGSEVIVEWRALTICLLDKLYDAWLSKYQVTSKDFPMVKLLEAGSWKAGRVIAKSKRSNGSPPIQIVSDGTVF